MTTTFHQILARCPVCCNEETLTVWDEIDVETDPDLREKLLLKTLQSLECRNCGHSTLIAAPLLYRDIRHGLVAECRPDLDRTQLEAYLCQIRQRPVPFSSGADPIQYRLTATMNELIEKILAREQKIDDEALELVKLAAIRHSLRETSVSELRFVGIAGQELNFVLKTEDDWFQYGLPLAAYLNACELLAQLRELGETWLPETGYALVDQTFAERCLSALTEAATAPGAE
jgi:Zn ribbon nucleic-acid-binding protein